MTKTVRRLVPQGRAEIARLGSVDFNALSLDSLKQQPYSSNAIDGSVEVRAPAPANHNAARRFGTNRACRREHANSAGEKPTSLRPARYSL